MHRSSRFWIVFGIMALLLAACGPEGINRVEGPAADPVLVSGAVTDTQDWSGQGSDSEKCRIPNADDPRFDLYEGGLGWIHWVFSTKGGSTDARLTIGADVYEPGEPLVANAWHFYTPFAEIALVDGVWTVGGHPVKIDLFGGARGPGNGLVISDYCPGREIALDVRKTAYTEFLRTHAWDIDKKVETEKGYELEDGTPKIWLYTDGTGDEKATWTVRVSYDGYTDSDFVVFGDIEIENISTSGKVITSITDDLGFPGYDNVNVDCGEDFALPYTIAVGEVLECTYRVEFEDGEVEEGDFGTNAVTVVVDNDPTTYGDTADWEFDEPTNEHLECVTITDTNPGFAAKYVPPVTVCVDDEAIEDDGYVDFTYDEDFAFTDFEECGAFRYPNIAEIVETKQTDDALLKVNVQCYLYESAWAKGFGEGVTPYAFCEYGFANWGWSNAITNPYEGSWPVYAGAGQCDVSKGTLVGTFEVEYNGDFSYEFKIDEEFATEGAAVYADEDMFPVTPGRLGGPTTAPGQYYVADDLSGPIFVIAHVNVGIPDPDFGPLPPANEPLLLDDFSCPSPGVWGRPDSCRRARVVRQSPDEAKRAPWRRHDSRGGRRGGHDVLPTRDGRATSERSATVHASAIRLAHGCSP
jgi:hypothetical protein